MHEGHFAYCRAMWRNCHGIDKTSEARVLAFDSSFTLCSNGFVEVLSAS
jgi:hypothetical protein